MYVYALLDRVAFSDISPIFQSDALILNGPFVLVNAIS